VNAADLSPGVIGTDTDAVPSTSHYDHTMAVNLRAICCARATRSRSC